MLNNTEHNNTLICVLPKNVEVPHDYNHENYCKKYAPKRTRKVVQKMHTLEWQVGYSQIIARNGRYVFIIGRMSHGCNMLVHEYFAEDNSYVGSFKIYDIPSVQDAMNWAERYTQSCIAYWGTDANGNPQKILWTDLPSFEEAEEVLCCNY